MGSVVVLELRFVLSSLRQGEKSPSFYLGGTGVRSGDSDLDSPGVHQPCGGFIGPGRGVDKGDVVSGSWAGY